MQSLELLADLIFANQPNDALTQQARAETLQRMQELYDTNLPEQQAELAVVLQCLAPQYVEHCRQNLRLQQQKQLFFKRYPIMLRTALLAIFILPIVFLALMFSVESKILFLTLWVTSIILISAFLIVLEYRKDFYLRLNLQNSDHQEELHP